MAIFGKILRFYHADPGWTSLMVAVVFFGGVQLLNVGILGAYIGNLFDEIKDRPEYVIKDMMNFETGNVHKSLMNKQVYKNGLI
jgi:dolichol-phosphate mannosyltransferase